MARNGLREFIRTYVRAIHDSNAAIFAGAGLSRPAGFVDWKELLREIADDLELDVDKEYDLIALAQYHVNEVGNRGKINSVLIENFTDGTRTTKNHELLAKLPIKTYWTTNYDKLIEASLERSNKLVDLKIVKENMSNPRPESDAVVYKMHGDISLPHEAVLTKDDYEAYEDKRSVFSTALRGDLTSKTFLFIGFSFDDPNLSYILSRIRALLGQHTSNHYCFMKKVNRKDYKTEQEFYYNEVKQTLKIKDLKRYSITVLLVEEYEEVTEILEKINYLVQAKNVFISGSAKEFGDWGESRSFEFSTKLSKAIIKNKNNVVSGFGVGIGSCIISGALEELYESNVQNDEKRLKSRPFPQNTGGKLPLKDIWTRYREEMLNNVGISIFIFGNKIDEKTGNLIDANGMIEEFEISLKKGVVPIPVGATGYTSCKLWQRVMSDFDDLIGIESLKNLYEELGDREKTDEEIIENILKIVNELNKI